VKYSLDYREALNDTEVEASLFNKGNHMSTPSAIHNTFVIERSYPHSPELVFAAFADPAKKRRWYAERNTHEVDEFEVDFRPQGVDRLTYRLGLGTPFPGVAITNEGVHCDIVPNERIIISSTMSLGGKHISVTLVTMEFVPTEQGTNLICTHQGIFFEGSGGPEMREAGWRSLLDALAARVAD
jgi:uncharacterized protein YndB with AHSA1/START domain